MLGAYSLGFDSAIATSFNILPQLGINILKEANTNQKEAVKIQDKLSSAINAITKFGTTWYLINSILMLKFSHR